MYARVGEELGIAGVPQPTVLLHRHVDLEWLRIRQHKPDILVSDDPSSTTTQTLSLKSLFL
jgi:hypothetical protein